MRTCIVATGRRALVAGVAMIALVGVAAEAGEKPFSLSVANGTAAVGDAGAISVTITAGEGFKANTEYPNKIKKLSVEGAADLCDGGVVPGATSGKNIMFSVCVTPTAVGTHNVTGQIRFSVCNDTECIIKKLPLRATITGE